jgi:hypothetical protein
MEPIGNAAWLWIQGTGKEWIWVRFKRKATTSSPVALWSSSSASERRNLEAICPVGTVLWVYALQICDNRAQRHGHGS